MNIESLRGWKLNDDRICFIQQMIKFILWVSSGLVCYNPVCSFFCYIILEDMNIIKTIQFNPSKAKLRTI